MTVTTTHRASADRAHPLPNFLYIGPDKAGSSWLHEVLIRHPQVFMPDAKDLYFFDRYFDRGPQWYAAQFRGATPAHRVVGEITQDYLFHPHAPARIHAMLPDARLMVTLREPAARAFSSYLYMLKQGETPGTFREALDRRPELIEHSTYAANLRRYLTLFDRSQLHVSLFDDLQADPQRFIDDLLAFLGLDPWVLDESLLAARLPAAKARSVLAARLARAGANVVRRYEGTRLNTANLIGVVKRSPLTQRVLYRPLGNGAPRLSPEDAALVRGILTDDVADLEVLTGLPLRQRWGWATAAAGANAER